MQMMLVVAVFVLGVVTGFVVRPYMVNRATVSGGLRQSALNKNDVYHFIDPLIALNDSSLSSSKVDDVFEQNLRSFITTQVQQKKLISASVMFIDEQNGKGFIINPVEQYSPASLLKVPTLISYYKLADENPVVLNKKITYTSSTDQDAQEHLPSPVQLQRGSTNTVQELLAHMIKYSDNNAATMLVDNLNTFHAGSQTFNTLFNDMGIQEISLDQDYITVQAYSLFFRILYNATYLNRDWSEKALKLLSETDFALGIQAGVPNATVVAHKFGEFSVQDTSGKLLKRELHDCGIVYYPGHPYLICVMTKGYTFPDLENVIGQISKEAYDYIQVKYRVNSD